MPRDIELWKVPDAWWQNGDIWGTEGLSAGVLQFIARLQGGASEAQARQQLTAFAERERDRQSAIAAAGFDLQIEPLQGFSVRDVRRMLLVLFGSVLCLLLIACANITNLLLVRMHSRRHELALRVALGSQRSRLVRLMILESIVLALLGGVGGAFAAVGGVPVLIALSPASLPHAQRIGVDGGVFTFAALLAAGSPFVFGLLPILRATRHAAIGDIRGVPNTTPDRARIGRTIAAAQLAISIVLAVVASLLAVSLLRLGAVHTGFEAPRLITFSVSLPGMRYHRPDGTDRFMRTLEDYIRSLSNVRAVGTIWPLPLSGQRWSGNYVLGRDPAGARGLADYRLASGGAFDALAIRMLDGRAFVASEPRDVVIVSRTFAQQAWPNERALGRTVQAAPWGGKSTAFEIIGVVDDVRGRTLRADAQPTLYFDMHRWSWTDWEMNVLVRTINDPRTVVTAVRSELARLDGNVPMAQVRLMTEYVADDLAANRFALTAVGGFAAIALVLTVLGVYGVVSYAVGQRTREFGLRMALGAHRASIVRLVVGDGVRLATIGVGAGLLAALWVTQTLEGLLFGTAPQDPVAFLGVAATLLIVTMVACCVPAYRASRVEPIETLRSE